MNNKINSLFEAAAANKYNKIDELLKEGIDPNTLLNGNSILTYITYRVVDYIEEELEKAQKTVHFLIERGVNPDIIDYKGLKPWQIAFQTEGKVEFGYFLRSISNYTKETHFNKLKEISFPEEVLEFLEANRNSLLFPFSGKNELDYVQLCAPEELRFTTIELDPQNAAYYEIEESYDEPNRIDAGNYKISAIDIIRKCPDYDNWGILAWIPSLKCFATADNDHGEIHVFKDTKWQNIIIHLEEHCCYQWDQSFKEVNAVTPYDVCKPWELWTFEKY